MHRYAGWSGPSCFTFSLYICVYIVLSWLKCFTLNIVPISHIIRICMVCHSYCDILLDAVLFKLVYPVLKMKRLIDISD